MTANILQSELSSLVQESKKRHPNVREAAERSATELKSLPSTSETQLAGDLIRRPRFVDPFILACRSRNAKLGLPAVICLQRLVACRAIPTERLNDVLEAMREVTSLAHALDICGVLQSSKTPAVGSTATATLQQLVVTVFEKLTDEDARTNEPAIVSEVTTSKGSISVSAAAYDALRVFNDLCLLVEDKKPQFLRVKSLSPMFVLELIESILTNSAGVFQHHPEQIEVLRNSLVPTLLKILSERQTFGLSVRGFRIVFLILKRHMTALAHECEMALSLLTHLTDPDANQPWRRVLCMEIFRGLYSDPRLIRQIYAQFDERERSKNILRDHMGALVRLASEKPALIGLGHQSTIPHQGGSTKEFAEEQAALEATGVGGVVGTAVSSADVNVTGISSEWSTMKLPCMDHLDKSEAPTIPDTYIYTLALNCIGAFSEGLARFVLPLTVPAENRPKRKQKVPHPDEERFSAPQESDSLESRDTSRPRASSSSVRLQLPLNPLESSSHSQLDSIKTCAAIVDACWPAFLATCSTFFYAALDSEFYHGLVRSFQKMTQVAGLLRATTPRDALLTTLGKAAVPADILATPALGSPLPSGDEKRFLSVEDTVSQSLVAEAPPRPSDRTTSSLTTRNLLCLRALVNLGIALGPTLNEEAWSIVLETLQQAELVINFSTRSSRRQTAWTNGEGGVELDEMTSQVSIGGEMAAVRTATLRMLDSTADYPSSSFLSVLTALLKLSGSAVETITSPISYEKAVPSPRSPNVQRKPGRMHQAARSISLSFGKSKIRDDELRFVVEKTKDLAKANLSRLTRSKPEESGWAIVMHILMEISQSGAADPSIRKRASGVINKICLETIKLSISEGGNECSLIHVRGLQTLKSQVRGIITTDGHDTTSKRAEGLDLHDQVLITLHSILEQCGDELAAGWDVVFELLCSVFVDVEQWTERNDKFAGIRRHLPALDVSTRSPNLVRSSFASLQLVGSDFLNQLTSPRLFDLETVLYLFGAQKDDLNISLTTNTFFWSLADHLRRDIKTILLDQIVDRGYEIETLKELANDQDRDVAFSTLWFHLLVQLRALSFNPKAEVRNGAIRVLFRVFQAYAGDISPEAWQQSFSLVLFDLLSDNLDSSHYQELPPAPATGDHAASWHETTSLIIEGLASLYCEYLTSLTTSQDIVPSYDRLLHLFDAAFKRPSFLVRTTALRGFRNILHQLNDKAKLGKDVGTGGEESTILRSSRIFFHEHNPVCCEHLIMIERTNESAIAAFLDAGEEYWVLNCRDGTEEDAKDFLAHIVRAVQEVEIPTYKADINSLSGEQRKVLDLMHRAYEKFEGDPSKIIPYLAELAECATPRRAPKMTNKSTQKFKNASRVQLAKACIEMMNGYVTKQNSSGRVPSEMAISRALSSLTTSIRVQTGQELRDAGPSTNSGKVSLTSRQELRKAASTAATDIISFVLPHLMQRSTYDTPKNTTRLDSVFENVIDVAEAIVSPYDIDSAWVHSLNDQVVDCEDLSKLHKALRPCLRGSSLPGGVALKYVQAIFMASQLYEPLSRLSEADVTKDLHQMIDSPSRRGQTDEPQSKIGFKVAYCALGLLFDLASTDAIPTTAFPYLLYRCAIAIQAYNIDRPLRGLQPSPSGVYDELNMVLRQLLVLNTPQDRPLVVLRPLLVTMTRVASKGSWNGDVDLRELALEALL